MNTRLTYEDFCRIPDDGMRHEIIDGVHYVTPSPVLRHQQSSAGGGLSKMAPLSANQDGTLTTPLLPGLALSLAKLFT